jgi:hypothetical protein
VSGYSDWTLSPFGRPWRIDGADLRPLGVQPHDKVPAEGAIPIAMADGRTVLQVHYRGTGDPVISGAYRWPFDLRPADDEEEHYRLRALAKLGRPVSLIDWEYEIEVFVAGDSLSSFTLPRPTAKSQWGGFPAGEYPTAAYVNGAAQAVVEVAPGAGEVQIVGSAVTTPALTAGDRLEVRYIPWYQVGVGPLARSLAAHNVYVVSGELLEVGP